MKWLLLVPVLLFYIRHLTPSIFHSNFCLIIGATEARAELHERLTSLARARIYMEKALKFFREFEHEPE